MKMKMMWKTVLLGLLTVGATVLAWGPQPRVDGETAAEAGRKWSMIELRQLSLGSEMSAVVSDMAGVDEWGMVMLSRERFQKRVDQLDVADLRTIVLHEATSGKDRKKTTKLAEFAETENPAATCAAAETVGRGGVEMCTQKCGNDKRYYHRMSSQERACLVLCTLAVDPCTEKRNMSWASWGMKSMAKTEAMVARGVLATTHLSSDDKDSLLVLLVLVLFVASVTIEQHDLYQQREKSRREDDDLASSQLQLQTLKGSHFFRPGSKKGRQYGLYDTKLVNYRDHQGISKAKIDAAHRREAHWKEEAEAAAAAAAAAAGDAVAGAGADGEGDGEGSKTEGAAGIAW